jgi:hypothetical protein
VFTNRLDPVLAAIVGGGLFLLGVGELISRLVEPAPLVFWLPTCGVEQRLSFLGSFRVIRTKAVSKAYVIVGGLLGLVPSSGGSFRQQANNVWTDGWLSCWPSAHAVSSNFFAVVTARFRSADSI